jgi:tRNA(Ile)-lysidine synthase TilS/MesJ
LKVKSTSVFKEENVKICKKCVLPEVIPGIEFDEEGVCNFCRESVSAEKSLLDEPFKNEQELIACLGKYRNLGRKYDVLVPLSGGVDSCNALITIVEKYKMKPLGFHNDHGYEDDAATRNCKELCRALDVDLVIMQQDFTFMKKLWKYIDEADVKGLNSCYVCGNILYLNALETAHRFNVPLVINGYSRGQAAQINDKDRGTGLLEKIIEVIRKTGDKDFFAQFMDKYKILEKRAAFLTRNDLEKGPDLDKILFIPFYIFEFYKIDKEMLKNEICKRCDWRPMKTSYPARTTNCEMIWLNTYMDLQKMGYSSYNLEYAELVRKGEFTREQALKDLEFNPPPGLVERLAGEIGVDIHKFTVVNEDQESEEKPADKKVEINYDF